MNTSFATTIARRVSQRAGASSGYGAEARWAMLARRAMQARWAMQARRAMQSPGYQVEAPAGLERVRLRRPAGPCTW